MGDRIPVYSTGGHHRRGRDAAVLTQGLDANDLVARADREVERITAELARVRVERDNTRTQLDELRVVCDRLRATAALPPQFPPEWTQCIKSKDELIERLALDYKESREQIRHAADSRAADTKCFHDMLNTERALTHDSDLKLRAALAQHTADANQRTDVGALRAENLRLLGKLSNAADQAKKAGRLAEERQLEITRLSSQLRSAEQKQIAAQEAELVMRRTNCDLQEQLHALRTHVFRPIAPSPTAPSTPVHTASPVPSATPRSHRSRSNSASLPALGADWINHSPRRGIRLSSADWAAETAQGLLSPAPGSPGGFRFSPAPPSPSGSSLTRQRTA